VSEEGNQKKTDREERGGSVRNLEGSVLKLSVFKFSVLGGISLGVASNHKRDVKNVNITSLANPTGKRERREKRSAPPN